MNFIKESTEGKYCRVESDDWHGIGNLFEWIHTGRCTFSSSLAHFPKEINATPTVDVDVNGSTNVDTSPAVSVVEEVPKPEAEPSKKQVSGESQCSVAMSSQSSICRMPVQFPQCLHHYISVYHAARKFCVPSLQIYALALLRARLSQDSRFGLTFPLDLRFAIKRSWTSDGSICIGEVDTELRTTLISVMFTWCSLLFSETVPAEVSVEIAEVVEWALGPGAGDFGTCFWASVISGKVERLEKGKGKDGEREDDCRTNVWVRENRAVKDELAWKVKEVEAMSRDGMAMEEAIIKSDLSVDEARVTGLL